MMSGVHSDARGWAADWDRQRTGFLPWTAYGLLVGLALLVHGLSLGATALTEHELQTAACARTMVLTGDWILPRLAHYLWLEKPPLSPWVAATSATLLGGFTETTVRLPSVLAALGIVVLIARQSSRWFGQTVGLLAGIVQATTFYTVTYARLAESDILLAFIVVAGITVFLHVQALERNDTRRIRCWTIVFWTFLGLSNLVKVPFFGAGLILGPCLLWLLWRRDGAGSRRIISPVGMVLALVFAAAWPAVALTRVQPELALWSVYYVRTRAFGQIVGSEPWWYYFTTIPWQLLPWTLAPMVIAGPSLRRAWRDPNSPDRFLWIWALLAVMTFSLFPGKHHHFLIHSLPAFSPLAALGLVRYGQLVRARTRDVVMIARACLAVVPPAALITAAILSHGLPNLKWDIWGLGACFAAAALGICLLILRGQPRAALVAFVITTVLISVEHHVRIQPIYDRSRQDRAFLRSLPTFVPADAPLVAVGGREIARHVFYARPTLQTVSKPGEILPRASGAPAIYVLARARDRDALRSLGAVITMAQSEYTHYERSPADRFTLFRLVPAVAAVRSER